uniref:Uncharacterized protein n=1 Tax=Cannabis sativa TaxID=3483 RepID=A0A803R2X5_CANSA
MCQDCWRLCWRWKESEEISDSRILLQPNFVSKSLFAKSNEEFGFDPPMGGLILVSFLNVSS